MVFRPDTALPIDIHGEVLLHDPSGNAVTLRAEGSRIRLATRGWESLHRLGPQSLVAKRRALVAVIVALNKLRLTLDVSVDGHRAFGIGAGVKTTLPARLLGLASVDIRLSDVLRLLRSRAAAPHAGR